ncbi:Importin subunit alpha-1b [Nymphaea thermarum]|nr:Importin subunit alpha-1b [Nymphaea thermarum]
MPLELLRQYVIKHEALQCLLNLLMHNHKKSIKKEACWTISNIPAGNKEQIQGCIKPLCNLLVCPDPRIVTVCLEGLENILKGGEAEKNMGNSGVWLLDVLKRCGPNSYVLRARCS